MLDALGSNVSHATWLGTEGSLEETIVKRRRLPFRPIHAGPLVGTNPLVFLRNVVKLVWGTVQVWRLLGRARPAGSSHEATSPRGLSLNRPDVVFVTGGYVCVPVAVAARLRGVPLVVYLPDVQPGRAVQFVARLANRIAVTAPEAQAFLPAGKSVVTGYPVREAIRTAEPEAGRRRLHLSLHSPVVLVFGGSQGARRLNRAVAGAAERLLERVEIVHVTGPREYARTKALWATLPVSLANRYHVHDYLHEEDMTAALAAADLVVSRAGAATLGEFPARGLPAIMVPLPISGGHQAHNARVLSDAGAALYVQDGLMDADRLAADVLRLVNDPGRLSSMGQAAHALDKPGAAAAIGREIVALAGKTPGGGADAKRSIDVASSEEVAGGSGVNYRRLKVDGLSLAPAASTESRHRQPGRTAD